MKNTEESHCFCSEGEGCFNICSTICKFLFALLRFKVYMMQTLMELIETCIKKEPNANPSDVSPNASPNVLIVEAIAKVVSTMMLDVRDVNVSRLIEVKGGEVRGIVKFEGTKFFNDTMFIGGEGDHHYLLPKALSIYAQEDPYMIKLLGQQKHINSVTKAPVGWIDGVCISYPTYLHKMQ
jgi:hypothetical protein